MFWLLLPRPEPAAPGGPLSHPPAPAPARAPGPRAPAPGARRPAPVGLSARGAVGLSVRCPVPGARGVGPVCGVGGGVLGCGGVGVGRVAVRATGRGVKKPGRNEGSSAWTWAWMWMWRGTGSGAWTGWGARMCSM
ncbi:hypothetical protein GCM10010271_43520 [Streptomyces kurssanovii]|nr:hypothetical protein GCM10010271_43520 [Streptomyces kurssanovii]